MEREINANDRFQYQYVQDFIKQTFPELKEVIGTFQGGLNESLIFSLDTESGEKSVVLRFPKSEEERTTTQTAIRQEYNAIGATKNGIDFRLRTITEQADFIQKANKAGLKILDYIDVSDNAMLMQYVQGTPLHRYVQQESTHINPQVIEDVLTSLSYAHRNGIVFGDRWTTNTIITSDEDFVELDFDIELIGDKETITSFELSQTIYHLMHFSGNNRDFMSEMIVDTCLKNQKLLNMYDTDKIYTFISGQTDYFYDMYQKTGFIYEEVVPPYSEVYMLIDELENLTGTNSN